MNKETLTNTIQQSLFLTQEVQQDILRFFEKLSWEQVQIIEQGLQAEKVLLLTFLRKLKDVPEMKKSALQEYLKKQKKILRNSKEYNEEIHKTQQLENLLEQLDIIY